MNIRSSYDLNRIINCELCKHLLGGMFWSMQKIFISLGGLQNKFISLYAQKSTFYYINWKQIVFTFFKFIWNRMELSSIWNQSKNGKYNLILVWFIKTENWFLRVYEDVLSHANESLTFGGHRRISALCTNLCAYGHYI